MSLEYTPIDQIPEIVSNLHKNFSTCELDSVQYRLNQLRNVYFALKDNMDEIAESVHKDFNRPTATTKTMDGLAVLAELLYVMDKLHEWVKPEPVPDIPLTLAAVSCSVLRVPLGVVCIISPFNFPLLLSVSPVVGAIASGNCALLKLPESTPHFSALLTDLLTKALDPEIFQVVNGGVKETTVLLEQKFDKILYTGGQKVAKIVATAAAKNLTPVVLELGGKSPAIVSQATPKSEIPSIARRIAWSRFVNAGQTCTSIDYVVCHESLLETFTAEIKRVVEEEFYPDLQEGGEDHPEWAHIINDVAFDRLMDMINNSKGEIITGGTGVREKKFIPPTIIKSVEWSDSTMVDEIFGPVLPILSYETFQDAIDRISVLGETPLACHIFAGTKAEQTIVTNKLRSGATMINDSVLQVAVFSAPFGGVGSSGYGNYHGKNSFYTFTHAKVVMDQPLFTESVMKVRYPPNTQKNDKIFWMTLLGRDRVWFNRTGNVRVRGANALWRVLTSTGDMFSLAYHMVF